MILPMKVASLNLKNYSLLYCQKVFFRHFDERALLVGILIPKRALKEKGAKIIRVSNRHPNNRMFFILHEGTMSVI